MATDQEFEKMLRAASLRVTRARIAVLNAVDARPHADANDVFDAIHHGTDSISKQAVYDVLTTLVDVGLLRCIKPSGSTARYERRVGTIITTRCAAIAEKSPTWIVPSARGLACMPLTATVTALTKPM